MEVCGSLRQFARVARPILKESDARRIIHRLEADIGAGYFQHLERDWRDVLRAAYEISAKHGFNQSCRSADLLHVAYAKESGAIPDHYGRRAIWGVRCLRSRS